MAKEQCRGGVPEMSEGVGPNVGGGSDDPDEHVRQRLGHALKVGREEAHLTQAHAAEALGISRDTLIRWEAGRGSVWSDPAQMARVLEVYGPMRLMPRNQVPAAPLDPELRREFLWRRNAAISRVEDPDAYVESMRAEHARHTASEKASEKTLRRKQE